MANTNGQAPAKPLRNQPDRLERSPAAFNCALASLQGWESLHGIFYCFTVNSCPISLIHQQLRLSLIQNHFPFLPVSFGKDPHSSIADTACDFAAVFFPNLLHLCASFLDFFFLHLLLHKYWHAALLGCSRPCHSVTWLFPVPFPLHMSLSGSTAQTLWLFEDWM